MLAHHKNLKLAHEKMHKGPSIKDVHSQGGRGFVQCRPFADKRRGVFFRCGSPHFLVQQTPDFSKFMVCPHGLGGRRSIFLDFVQTSFMHGP